MAGKKGMSNPRYSQEMKATIWRMVEEGKTQREIAEHLGLKDRFVVHQILKRERNKQNMGETIPRKRGRPSKAPPETIATLKAENERLRMENDLMKSFLELAGRG